MTKIGKETIAKSYRELTSNVAPLDEEERRILDSWKETTEDNLKNRKDLLKTAIKMQKQYKKSKDKTINLRVNGDILNNIKEISSKFGLNYQSYIGAILTQVANGNIKLEITQK